MRAVSHASYSSRAACSGDLPAKQTATSQRAPRRHCYGGRRGGGRRGLTSPHPESAGAGGSRRPRPCRQPHHHRPPPRRGPRPPGADQPRTQPAAPADPRRSAVKAPRAVRSAGTEARRTHLQPSSRLLRAFVLPAGPARQPGAAFPLAGRSQCNAVHRMLRQWLGPTRGTAAPAREGAGSRHAPSRWIRRHCAGAGLSGGPSGGGSGVRESMMPPNHGMVWWHRWCIIPEGTPAPASRPINPFRFSASEYSSSAGFLASRADAPPLGAGR